LAAFFLCYAGKKFFGKLFSWGRYYKTAQTRNVKKMNTLRSKLVSFLLSVTFTS